MSIGANIEETAGRRVHARALAVVALFGLSLLFLALGNYLIIPTSTYDPVHGLLMAALASALAMLVVGLPERESRRMLALLLGTLGAGLLLLKVLDVRFRFIAKSDEGEFSMALIAMLATAAILWATTAIRLAPAGIAGGTSPRYPGLKEYAVRVLWSTHSRRTIVIALGGLYAVAFVVGLATGDSSAGTGDGDAGVVVALLVSGGAVLLGGRVASPTLKTVLFLLAGLLGIGLLLSIGGVGILLIVLGLHASIAIAGLAASAAAVDAQTPAAKTIYSLLALVSAVAWMVLACFGLIVFAIATSGYES